MHTFFLAQIIEQKINFENIYEKLVYMCNLDRYLYSIFLSDAEYIISLRKQKYKIKLYFFCDSVHAQDFDFT